MTDEGTEALRSFSFWFRLCGMRQDGREREGRIAIPRKTSRPNIMGILSSYMWNLFSPASTGCHLCVTPDSVSSLGGEVWLLHSFLLLLRRRQVDTTSEDAIRQWQFDVVYTYKYIFMHGSLSTDTFHVLHVFRIRDKVQILVLLKKAPLQSLPDWCGGTGITMVQTYLLPRGPLQTPPGCGFVHPCVYRMAGISLSSKKVVCSPTPASRSQGRAIHVEGPGPVIHLNFLPP